jgi:transposase
MVERARIILLADEGRTNEQIASALETRTARVSKWRQRFGAKRLAGLADAARSGKPAKYDQDTEKSVLRLLAEPPPKGYSQWNGRLLAEALPNISKDQVWRILRRHDICLERRRSWCISTDPEFGPKAVDIVGLYLNPPANAVVISVDEKPSIPALKPAQGYVRLPDGKAVNGFSLKDRRRGATTLFAALEAATGQAKTAHDRPRRRREFLDFLNEIAVANPNREVYVMLDNRKTHTPKEDRWLQRHPDVQLHFTPDYSSWLNQAECWFSILNRPARRGAGFSSPRQLRQAIEDFVAAYHASAAPFEWKKAVVFPSELTSRFSG